MLINKKMNKVNSFVYLCSIVSKEDGRIEDVKSRIHKPQVFQIERWKKFGRIGIKLLKIRKEYWKPW